MKPETRLALSWRRHLSLWWRQARSWWALLSCFHVVLLAWMYRIGGHMLGLAMVSSLCLVVAQAGLWFAVGEREQRRLGEGKGPRP